MPWLPLTFPAVIASFQHESMFFCLCGPYRAGLVQIMELQLNNCLQLSKATVAISVNSPGQDICQVIPFSCQTLFLYAKPCYICWRLGTVDVHGMPTLPTGPREAAIT